MHRNNYTLSNRVINPAKIHILPITNRQFAAHYHLAIDTMRCYAQKNGYSFSDSIGLDWEAGKSNDCNCISKNLMYYHDQNLKDRYTLSHHEKDDALPDFFFIKHCLVACYLEKMGREKLEIAIVVDADVLIGNMDSKLDFWIEKMVNGHQSKMIPDILLYERCTNIEIAAGNYMVKNTANGIAFLKGWSELWKSRPPGFSSSDNGALHIHLMRAVGMDGLHNFDGVTTNMARKDKLSSNFLSPDANTNLVNETNPCAVKFFDLIDSVENLKPYFEYIDCARKQLQMGFSPKPSPDLAMKSEWDPDYVSFQNSSINGITVSATKNGLIDRQSNAPFIFTIFPHSKGWIHDYICGMPASMQQQAEPHPIFYHGVKQELTTAFYYKIHIDDMDEGNNYQGSIYPLCTLQDDVKFGEPQWLINSGCSNTETGALDMKCIHDKGLGG